MNSRLVKMNSILNCSIIIIQNQLGQSIMPEWFNTKTELFVSGVCAETSLQWQNKQTIITTLFSGRSK